MSSKSRAVPSSAKKGAQPASLKLLQLWQARAAADEAVGASFEASAQAGRLDEVCKQASVELGIDDLQEFFDEAMENSVSTFDRRSDANDNTVDVHVDVFALPVHGLSADVDELVNSHDFATLFRKTSISTPNANVIMLGALSARDAFDLGPQVLWNLTRRALEKLSGPAPARLEDVAELCALVRDSRHEETVYASPHAQPFVVVGLRVGLFTPEDAPDVLIPGGMDSPSTHQALGRWLPEVQTWQNSGRAGTAQYKVDIGVPGSWWEMLPIVMTWAAEQGLWKFIERSVTAGADPEDDGYNVRAVRKQNEVIIEVADNNGNLPSTLLTLPLHLAEWHLGEITEHMAKVIAKSQTAPTVEYGSEDLGAEFSDPTIPAPPRNKMH